MNGALHISIDAGCLPVLDRLAEHRVMPNFADLRQSGGTAVLRSTEPWFTVPGWVSWMTGVPATQHGLIAWSIAKPRDYWRDVRDRFVESVDIPFPTVFDVASSATRSVASVNMPVTFPPKPVNGVMISGFPSPLDARRVCRPPEFLDRYPSYVVDIEARPGPDVGPQHDDVVASYAARLEAMTRARAEVAVDLLRAGHDLVSVVFVGPDRLLHVAWPAVADALDGRLDAWPASTVVAYYRELDRALGSLVAAAGDRVVLVTSDHGQQAPSARQFRLNAWLAGRGHIIPRLGTLRRFAGVLPTRVRRGAWWALRQRRERPLHAPPLVDWERTAAYGIVFPHCQMVGVALRDPGDRLADELANELLALEDPATDERPVERVVLGREWMDPPHGDRAPDLIAFLAPGWGTAAGTEGDAFLDGSKGASGEHSREGLVVARGPGVARGVWPTCDIHQVAATLLAAVGVVPLPHMASGIPWIAGNVDGLQDVPFSETPTRSFASDISTDEEAEVMRHLRGLGYLE